MGQAERLAGEASLFGVKASTLHIHARNLRSETEVDFHSHRCRYTMATRLSALEARRDKTYALKQGMMQELLTGRTRLV